MSFACVIEREREIERERGGGGGGRERRFLRCLLRERERVGADLFY